MLKIAALAVVALNAPVKTVAAKAAPSSQDRLRPEAFIIIPPLPHEQAARVSGFTCLV
jgi:hypothetical protein